MAAKHFEQVLQTAGLSPEQIKALNELPEDAKDFKTDDYIAPINTAVETRVKNDPKFYEGLNKDNLPPEFLKNLRGSLYGEEAGKVRHHILKGLGLSDQDFSDLGDDFKKIEIFTPAVIKKLSEGKVTDKELQKKLIEANQQLEELKNKTPQLEEQYNKKYDEKVNELKVESTIISTLATVQNLKAPAEYLSDKLIKDLRAKYAFAVENGVVELRQKDKPTLKALNANNTKELSLSEAITAILEAGNLIDKKKVDQKPGPGFEVNTGKGGLVMSANVNDKVQKLMAEEKAAG